MPKFFQDLKKRVKSVMTTGKILEKDNLYKYGTVEERENTISYLYDYAKGKRSDQEQKWRLYDDYYNNKHVTQIETYDYCQSNNIPWVPAIIPDPYIHVESQIIPDIPTFEFNGRDDDMDSQKAKQRQYVVQYVIDNNDIDAMNTENERDLGKLGNAFWKVSWDNKKKKPNGIYGDIVVHNPKCEEIFHDPTAFDLDDCEYVDYVYSIHKLKAGRIFANELSDKKMSIEEYGTNTGFQDTNLLDSTLHDTHDDTVQVIEHWFRQPYNGSDTFEYEVDGKKITQKVEWESGDIACCILINYKEIKYIPKFWMKTGKQNKMYPFSKYCKVPIPKSFWDKSDIETIKDLVDATDRELAMALLNDTYMANDIILMEETAFSDDNVPRNEPGAMWKVKDGKMGSVARLQGIQGNRGQWDTIQRLRELIQETIGNFDSAMGKEPVRVTTASGIAQLNERADYRKNIKKADRTAGFQRLFKLIDYMALEFYDDNRIIYIGADKDGGEPNIFQYNSDNILQQDQLGEQYIPDVDIKIIASDPLTKSKSFTLSATENLLAKQITPSNYKIVESMIEIMNLPNRKEISDMLEQTFKPQLDLQNIKIEKEIQNIVNPPQQQPIQQPQQSGTSVSDEEVLAGLTPEELDFLHQNPHVAMQAGLGQ